MRGALGPGLASKLLVLALPAGATASPPPGCSEAGEGLAADTSAVPFLSRSGSEGGTRARGSACVAGNGFGVCTNGAASQAEGTGSCAGTETGRLPSLGAGAAGGGFAAGPGALATSFLASFLVPFLAVGEGEGGGRAASAAATGSPDDVAFCCSCSGCAF